MYQISNSHFIEQNLQATLEMLSLWCKHNGMLLNTDKTKVMLITTSQKRLRLHDHVLNLTYNSDSLKNVNNDKVLGFLIDNNLTRSIHMQSIAKKISSNLWLLSKLKEFFSLQFYKTYIQPHIDNCSTVLGGTSHSNLYRIDILQKRTIKIILDYEYMDIASRMNERNILNIFETVFLRKACIKFQNLSLHLILMICSPSEQ